MEYGTIDAFRTDPAKVWVMLEEMSRVMDRAQANDAHKGLARLEGLGLLQGIITQNIDNLHQEAGSKKVIEYHGNCSTLSCLSCHEKYRAEAVSQQLPPKCTCGQILKPDVVFFGEAIPTRPVLESQELASACQAFLVVGTSATVAPANAIPRIAQMTGATVIEINIAPTVLTPLLTEVFLQGKATEVVTALVEEVTKMVNPNSERLLRSLLRG
jgi:NAD-dependent deacetylase